MLREWQEQVLDCFKPDVTCVKGSDYQSSFSFVSSSDILMELYCVLLDHLHVLSKEHTSHKKLLLVLLLLKIIT